MVQRRARASPGSPAPVARRVRRTPMVEVLQFVFSSFWVWLGTLVLLVLPVLGVVATVGAWKNPVADPKETARLVRAELDREVARQAAQRQIHQGRHA